MAEISRHGASAEVAAGPMRLNNQPSRPTIDQAAEPHFEPAAERRRFPWRLASFALMVLVPFLLTLVYVHGFAADQFFSEARFAVRAMEEQNSQSDESSGGLLSLNSATQDAHVVSSFIHSSEMLQRLSNSLDYRAIFDRPEADNWALFDPDAPLEAFLRYWREHVSVYIDGPSGIVTLRVRAFRPEDARVLTQAILDESELLLNELSARARIDIIAQAQNEVERSSTAYRAALDQLNAFQIETSMLSPEAQAAQSGGLLAGLMAQKLELESRLYVLRDANAVNSPSFGQLQSAAQSINNQIASLQDSLTGQEGASVAQSIVEFARLETDRQVAQAIYEASRRGYDQAVSEAMRKSLYVMVFVNPTAAQEPGYPNRMMTPILVLIGCFAVWATLSLICASIEDHKL